MKRLLVLVSVICVLLCSCAANTTPAESATPAASTGKSASAGNTVTQNGKNGSISLVLPDGWSYRLLAKGDKKLLSGDYGIQFYPENAPKGFVELAYHKVFGICGTGLEQKKLTLAGDKAYACCYDGSDIWDFIIFDGKNDKIVAVASETEKWESKYRGQLMRILDTMEYSK